MSEVGPAAGETHHHPPRGDEDWGGDFDQARPPRAGLAFAQRIPFAAAVVMIAAFLAGERLGGKFVGEVFRERIARRATQANEEIVGGGVHVEPKQIGHVAVVAQAVGLKTVLEFLVAVFAFAAIGEAVVSRTRQEFGSQAALIQDTPSAESVLAAR